MTASVLMLPRRPKGTAVRPIPPERRITPKLRVYVHADDPITKSGIGALLGEAVDIAVVTHDPDVVLAVAGVVTAEAVEALAGCCGTRGDSAVRVVLIAERVEQSSLAAMLDLGVVVVIPREQASAERVVSGLRLASVGGAHLPPMLLDGLLEQLRQLNKAVLEPQGLTLAGLSAREREVIRLTAEGLDTAEIAQRLNFSEGTIKAVVQVVLRRYGLRNRAHMVAYAMRVGMI